MAAAPRLGGLFHERAADAVALVAGHDADLGGMADAFEDGRSKDHGDEAVAADRAHEEGSLGEKLAAAGEDDNVSQEFHAAGFGAVLVVDFAVYMIRVGQLDEASGG